MERSNDATAPPPLEGFHHITLPVDDLDRAQWFYVEVLGGRLLRRFDRAALLRLAPERGDEVDERLDVRGEVSGHAGSFAPAVRPVRTVVEDDERDPPRSTVVGVAGARPWSVRRDVARGAGVTGVARVVHVILTGL